MIDPFLIPVPASEMRMSDPDPAPVSRWGRGWADRIDIAVALDCSAAAVRRRARREGWIWKSRVVRGYPRRLYRIAELPADVRSALGGAGCWSRSTH